MIVRDRPGVYQLLFAMRGSILPIIAPQILVVAAVAVGLVLLQHHFAVLPAIDATPFTVFGIALSLFLGFRNNAAYDRWWEARRLWGGLLADVRSLARETEVFVQDKPLRTKMLGETLAFMHLHRANLRQLPDDTEAKSRGSQFLTAPHPPCAALDSISADVAQGCRNGQIDGFGARTLTARVGSLALQQAGCERIALTPLPFVYSLLIYRTIYIYCFLLPLALVGPAGWMTPVFVAIVAYVFLGLAEVTEELSHPFGSTTNGLPLDAICRAAEISIAPHLGLEAPQPLRATDYYLS
ncbi:bestrophin family protein [Aestuariivirga sp.]|uniref:bestrophin family protein n=1 Tax=Aestuariivirga sp. TaxID=2650926 RepID=UPI0039E24296